MKVAENVKKGTEWTVEAKAGGGPRSEQGRRSSGEEQVGEYIEMEMEKEEEKVEAEEVKEEELVQEVEKMEKGKKPQKSRQHNQSLVPSQSFLPLRASVRQMIHTSDSRTTSFPLSSDFRMVLP